MLPVAKRLVCAIVASVVVTSIGAAVFDYEFIGFGALVGSFVLPASLLFFVGSYFSPGGRTPHVLFFSSVLVWVGCLLYVVYSVAQQESPDGAGEVACFWLYGIVVGHAVAYSVLIAMATRSGGARWTEEDDSD